MHRARDGRRCICTMIRHGRYLCTSGCLTCCAEMDPLVVRIREPIVRRCSRRFLSTSVRARLMYRSIQAHLANSKTTGVTVEEEVHSLTSDGYEVITLRRGATKLNRRKRWLSFGGRSFSSREKLFQLYPHFLLASPRSCLFQMNGNNSRAGTIPLAEDVSATFVALITFERTKMRASASKVIRRDKSTHCAALIKSRGTISRARAMTARKGWPPLLDDQTRVVHEKEARHDRVR